MKKIVKGEYGYIEYQKKWSIIRTILFFIICIGIFVAGYITTGTRNNLLTIVAILGCLPACKSAVNAVMFLRATGCSENAYNIIEEYSKTDNESTHIYGLYDLYMTSYKTNYAFSHLSIAEKTIIALCEDTKTDLSSAENHIKEHLKQDGYKDITVKVYNDINKYSERLEQLHKLELKPLKSQDSILEMLISISL